MQKGHQKQLEEAPSPFISEDIRKKMGEAAIKAARAASYYSLGTVEFVVSEDGSFYFIEMNTRLQVEHPVTEEITDIDLVHEQIRIAAGMQLPLSQDKVQFFGHAIECRICALEPGEISYVHLPDGYKVRVESHIFSGYRVSPYYDPMIAKIIVLGKTRLEAIRRLRRALEELVIEGIRTNVEFMHILTFHPGFIKGRYNTEFLEKHYSEIEKLVEEGT